MSTSPTCGFATADGCSEESASVSGFSLAPFDRNRYSVRCDQVGKTVQVKAYAGRVVLVSEGLVVGEHERRVWAGADVFQSLALSQPGQGPTGLPTAGVALRPPSAQP